MRDEIENIYFNSSLKGSEPIEALHALFKELLDELCANCPREKLWSAVQNALRIPAKAGLPVQPDCDKPSRESTPPTPEATDEAREAVECRRCKFYWDAAAVTQCRRLPPAWSDDTRSAFPDVLPGDWCGEFIRAQLESAGVIPKEKVSLPEGMARHFGIDVDFANRILAWLSGAMASGEVDEDGIKWAKKAIREISGEEEV